MGVLEAHETPVYWGPWAAHMFPVIGLVRVATGALLVFLLFRPKIAWKQRPTVFPSPERFDGNDIRALLLIASAAGLWATDVFHGIHPVLVGMGVAVVAFMPHVGPLNITVLDRLNYPILIYIGSVFAIGEALVATAIGLLVALPAVAFFNLFQRSIRARLARGNALGSEVLAYLKSEPVPAGGPFRTKGKVKKSSKTDDTSSDAEDEG